MLALLGALTVVVLLAVIMLNLLSPLVALIAVPVAAALLGGFGLATSKFIIAGISAIAPVAGMFVFAILYFGIMTDAGMLDPIIARILRAVGARPTRIVVGTALLALLIHLDGSGAVCFLVTIPAMLPLYERARHGPARPGLRGVAGGRRQLPALDGADAAGVGRAEDPGRQHLPAHDRRAGGRPGLRVRRRLAARQARGAPARARRRRGGRVARRRRCPCSRSLSCAS